MKALVFLAVFAAMGFYLGSPPDLQGKQSIPKLSTAKVQIKIHAPFKNGRYQIMRGKDTLIDGGPWGPYQSSQDLHIRKHVVNTTNANGQSAPSQQEVMLQGLYVNGTVVNGKLLQRLAVPISLQDGNYLLQIDVEGVGSSDNIPIAIIDPPVEILAFDPPKGVGGPIAFKVNFAPPGSKIRVTKTQAARAPDEWWAKDAHPTGQSEQILTPEIGGDGYFLNAKMSAGLGAGSFTAQLIVPSGQQLPLKGFITKYDVPEFPVFALRYEGIDSLVDTNELGDDEIYPIFCVGEQRMTWNPNLSQWSDYPPKSAFSAFAGPYAMRFQKGQSRTANFDIKTCGEYAPVVQLGLGVALFEKDGGDLPFYLAQVGIALQGPSTADPKLASEFLDSYIHNAVILANQKSISISDEYLGTKNIPLVDVMKRARKAKGWQRTSVVIEGDGGKFRVRILVKAEPKVGAYDK
jgi:hypothetical protein